MRGCGQYAPKPCGVSSVRVWVFEPLPCRAGSCLVLVAGNIRTGNLEENGTSGEEDRPTIRRRAVCPVNLPFYPLWARDAPMGTHMCINCVAAVGRCRQQLVGGGGRRTISRRTCTTQVGRVITKRRGYDSITPYQCGGGTMASKGVVQPARRREHDLAARPTTMIPTCHAARYSHKSERLAG